VIVEIQSVIDTESEGDYFGDDEDCGGYEDYVGDDEDVFDSSGCTRYQSQGAACFGLESVYLLHCESSDCVHAIIPHERVLVI